MSLGGIIFIALSIGLLGLMVWGWLGRRKRDRGITVPIGKASGSTVAAYSVLHVATTAHDDPLNRLAIGPLGYRGRGAVAVTTGGVSLEIVGAPTVFFAAEAIAGVGHATWTIDRVVEKDGLALLAWTDKHGTICDTYLRLESATPATFIDEVAALTKPATTAGESA